MDEDSSLEEFTTGTTGDGAGAERTDESGEAGSGIEADSEEPVTPTVSTYRYSPEKEACRACGTRVRRRWRDGGGLVCGECKEW
jgi:hypothetical protein